jgi:DNA repair protein RadA/Sms
LDRVLGGGMVEGGVVLIGGDPGIGKSTLLLQALDAELSAQMPVLYVTGEESGAQVALRSRRLGLDPAARCGCWPRSTWRRSGHHRRRRPRCASSTRFKPCTASSSARPPARWRRCANARRSSRAWPRHSGCTVVLVGHVTKEGALAGPRVLEHIVDTVLYFEGDTHSSFRLVRAIKNRFGAVNEIGVFAMTEKGLKGVSNPSAIFLSTHASPCPAVACW